MSTLDLLAARLPAVVDLRTAARETGFAEQTIRNSLHKGKCPFRGYKDGNRWRFRLLDLAAYIDSRFVAEECCGNRGPAKLGRPTKKEQVERRQAAQSLVQQRQGGGK